MRASTSSSSCKDGARRSYSMANAPHTLMRPVPGGTTSAPMVELHIRHMPGGEFTDQVFGAMKEKRHPACRRALRQLFPARGLREAHHPAGLGHRLCADQGRDRAPAVPRHQAPRHAVLGRPAARRPVPGRLGASPVGRNAEPALCAGGLGRPARGRLERPHRLRAPGGAAGLRRTSPATRSTPAARPSSSTRPARTSRRWPGCPKTSFLQIPSPAKRTKHP